MPARIVPLVTEEYYHIFNRGINKQPVFLDAKDYKRAIEAMRFYALNPTIKLAKFFSFSNIEKQELLEKFEKENDDLVKLICYCLMPNHFHFLLKQTKDFGISKFMSNFQNSYTRYFNTKYGKFGPIFQGQFKAVRVEDDNQLLHLSRYIHLNPYSSLVVKNLDKLVDYLWSSLPQYLSKVDNEVCDKEIILSSFQSKDKYRMFVFDNANYQRTLEAIKHLSLES